MSQQWNICRTSVCDICNVSENYEHMFLKCKYLNDFWKKIHELLQKLKIGLHVLSIKNLIFGYKIEDNNYYDINYFLTILMFAIHKCYYMSEQKVKKIDIYRIFRHEFINRIKIMEMQKKKVSYFLKNVAKLI